jgi:hypothetical protein
MIHRRVKLSWVLVALLLACPGGLSAARKAKAARASSRGNPALAAHEALNEGKNPQALLAYKRVIDRRDDPALRCEYAFVLARLGLQDAALGQLDQASKAKRFPGTGAWFRAKILKAAGVENAPEELGKDSEGPAWLKDQELAAFVQPEKGGTLNQRFINANRLAAQGSLHAAAAEFSSALRERPKDTLGWIGLSLALEKMGAPDSARKALDSAAPLAENSQELKKLVELRRAQLSDSSEEEGLTPREAKRRRQRQNAISNQGRILLFGGGSFGSSSSALSGRFGYFLTPTLDAAADLSLVGVAGTATSAASSQVGVGVSSRYYWPVGEKAGAVALGARVGYQANQATYTLSPGFTSPVGDFFLDFTVSPTGYQMGFTIGAVTYFGGGK